MNGEYRLTGTAELASFEAVHELFAGITEPVESLDLMLFETAVVEVIGNLVQHGRPPGEVRFDLVVHVTDESLLGTVTESGETVPPELSDAMPEPSVESGRGLPLIRAVLDEFKFERVDDRNYWRLRRSLLAD